MSENILTHATYFMSYYIRGVAGGNIVHNALSVDMHSISAAGERETQKVIQYRNIRLSI